MIEEVMRATNNFFPGAEIVDKFTIQEGVLALPFTLNGAYILVEGSAFNDGVHKNPLVDGTDETFSGCVTILSPPKAFLDLVGDIEAYEEKNAPSPYQSESFGGYSYTKATTSSGNIAGWREAFRTRLNAWRKI